MTNIRIPLQCSEVVIDQYNWIIRYSGLTLEYSSKSHHLDGVEKNRKWAALKTDNVRKMVILLFTVLASTVFTSGSYEYQILLEKPFIIGVVFAHTIE